MEFETLSPLKYSDVLHVQILYSYLINGKISQCKPIEQSLRNEPSSQSHTTLPSAQVPFPLQIGVPGHVAMSQRSPVNPLKHSQIPVLPIQVPLPLHVVESSHTTKKTLHYLEFQKKTLQTYSKFLD